MIDDFPEVDAVSAPSFCLVEERRSFDTGWHEHPRHQLLYSARGALRLEVGDGQWLLPPALAAWIRPRARHRVRATEPVSLRTVYLAPRLLQLNAPEQCRVFAVPPLAREMLLHAARWSPAKAVADPIAPAFFRALGALVPEWAARPLPWRIPRAATPELEQALQWTLDRLGKRPTLDGVAAKVGLSPRSLARRFEAELGMGFRPFLSTARMMKAMELLAAPGARVSQVAWAVGFKSLAAFTHAFTRLCGERPKDYRARTQAGGR